MTVTIEDVIRNIIFPATAISKESYIATFLRNKQHYYCRSGFNNNDFSKLVYTPECTKVMVLSWKMPFYLIAKHLEYQLWVDQKNKRCSDEFYWIDIFCCNFHVPSTIIEEMNRSMDRAETVTVAMWPSEKICVFNQPSSCYQMWYAAANNINVRLTSSAYLELTIERDLIDSIDLSQCSDLQNDWTTLMVQTLEASGTNLEEFLCKVIQFIQNLMETKANCADRSLVYGVNLAFIEEFIIVNNITATMTTSEVVEKIIKPQTAHCKESYLFAKLRDKPYYFADLSRGREINGQANELKSMAFISHTWGMLFVHIPSILKNSCKHVSLDGIQGFERSSYFWIDVFCKNQHIPAPVVDEFHKALITPGRLIVLMWPRQPLALTRIWCLYEIWCAIHNGLGMRPEFLDDDIPKSAEDLQIDLRRATATVPADVDMIMALIEETVGAEAMTQKLTDYVTDMLNAKRSQLDGYNMLCFDGNGDVLLRDGKATKKVRDIQIGDCVLTLDGQTAKVVLITCDVVATPTIEVCEINGMLITPEHPIFNETSKVFAQPQDFLPIKQAVLDKIYNFELDVGHTVVINGVGVACLGRPGAELPFDDLYGNGWKTNPDREKWIKFSQMTS